MAYHLQVSILGFASPETGSPAYNQALSLARARAIRVRLITLGVSPDRIVQVRGKAPLVRPSPPATATATSTRCSAPRCVASSSYSALLPVPRPDRHTNLETP